jgi:hypothetical protein
MTTALPPDVGGLRPAERRIMISGLGPGVKLGTGGRAESHQTPTPQSTEPGAVATGSWLRLSAYN